MTSEMSAVSKGSEDLLYQWKGSMKVSEATSRILNLCMSSTTIWGLWIKHSVEHSETELVQSIFLLTSGQWCWTRAEHHFFFQGDDKQVSALFIIFQYVIATFALSPLMPRVSLSLGCVLIVSFAHVLSCSAMRPQGPPYEHLRAESWVFVVLKIT